ncbi:MFS transporter [Sporolactobacillus shoreae]|uniref:MFS transporter n=1 Tax=Sporolactobacillus shoreae TaxID=1465501 RepID=A0A4Z0GSY5_9BACL|nr:MFS transporter [Sporolactobacillus shoreae]TGB00349.1 MFS transporter [Sporolactobacillus shoreae]
MNGLLHNKNFSLLFTARLITNIGDSMYYVAAMWLVYKLGGSAFYSGLAGFLTLIPRTFQFTVGPILDRYSIQKLLITTQLFQALILSLIPLAYLSGRLSVTLILIVMPIVSFLSQFSYPAENALIPHILKKEQRVQANSAMAIAYQGTESVFNAVGGALVALIGAIAIYTADIITFSVAVVLFSMLSLSSVRRPERNTTIHQQIQTYFSDLKEGFHIVFHSVIGRMIISGQVTNFALGALTASLPSYADLLGGSWIYGLMLAGMAVGSLVGAMCAGFFEKVAVGKMLMIGYLIGFCLWISAALIPNSLARILLFSASLIPLGCNNVINSTVMQNLVPKELLARVMSVVASIATCMMPLGALTGGTLSALFGPNMIFTFSSFGFLFYSVYVALTPVLRTIPAVGKVKPESYGFSAVTSVSEETYSNET